MSQSPDALVEPSLLTWARERLRLPVPRAAERIGISERVLLEWERGDRPPTMNQLRKAANVYRQSLAAFFLPSPPVEPAVPPLPDHRAFPDADTDHHDIWADVAESTAKRDILLELAEQIPLPIQGFELTASFDESPEVVGARLRKGLKVVLGSDGQDVEPRVALNTWRAAAEAQGVLVFQTSTFDISAARGYSITVSPLPIVVLNRKDAYAGRTFTLAHELCHIMTNSGGVCDLGDSLHPTKVEAFCNRVAGAALVPSKLLRHRAGAHAGPTWSDLQLADLAKSFGISRQVILRRLLDLGMTTQEFFESTQRRLEKEVPKSRRSGMVPPAADVLSTAGRPYVRTVVQAMDSGRITDVDAADYLGLRQKHFARLREVLG